MTFFLLSLKNNDCFLVDSRIGALAKYRCERGYKIVGEPLVTCEENGLWSGQVPECICEYKPTHALNVIII